MPFLFLNNAHCLCEDSDLITLKSKRRNKQSCCLNVLNTTRQQVAEDMEIQSAKTVLYTRGSKLGSAQNVFELQLKVTLSDLVFV